MTAEQHSQDYSKTMGDELRLLYTSCVSEIASFKQQQWNTTNYGLVSYAGIVSLTKIVATRLVVWELTALYMLTGAVLLAGIYFVCMLDKSIQLRRGRLSAVRGYFAKEFRDAWLAGRPEERKQSLLWFFLAVFAVGFVVTVRLLTKYAYAAY